MDFPDDMTLGEARAALRELVVGGYKCPCCTQMARIYRRRITRPMAKALIECWQKGGSEFVYVADLPTHSSDFAKLVYWNLIEEQKTIRPDGGRAGYWRVTPKGEEYLYGEIVLPKYAKVYDAKCLGLDDTELADIQDALGGGFNLVELMGERGNPDDGQVALPM